MITNLFLKLLNREASSPGHDAQRIMEKLAIVEGYKIADIGSGGGYFALEFARRVGESGRVYAVDNSQKSLDFVRQKANAAGLNNMEFVLLVGNDGPDLPAASLDLIFARNVFHHLSEPAKYFRKLRKAVKPDGKIVVIDHMPGHGFSFTSIFRHVTPVERILETMKSAGFQLSESFDFLSGESFSIFCPAANYP